MKDIYHDVAVVQLYDPTDLAKADKTSNILDTAGFESAEIIAVIGALSNQDATNYVTPVLQESDTTADGDFTTVGATDMINGFSKVDAAAEDSVSQKCCYLGSKRYIRVLFDVTSAGAGPDGYCAAVGILSGARHKPVGTVAAVTAT
jgi:hypothetical protein